MRARLASIMSNTSGYFLRQHTTPPDRLAYTGGTPSSRRSSVSNQRHQSHHPMKLRNQCEPGCLENLLEHTPTHHRHRASHQMHRDDSPEGDVSPATFSSFVSRSSRSLVHESSHRSTRSNASLNIRLNSTPRVDVTARNSGERRIAESSVNNSMEHARSVRRNISNFSQHLATGELRHEDDSFTDDEGTAVASDYHESFISSFSHSSLSAFRRDVEVRTGSTVRILPGTGQGDGHELDAGGMVDETSVSHGSVGSSHGALNSSSHSTASSHAAFGSSRHSNGSSHSADGFVDPFPYLHLSSLMSIDRWLCSNRRLKLYATVGGIFIFLLPVLFSAFMCSSNTGASVLLWDHDSFGHLSDNNPQSMLNPLTSDNGATKSSTFSSLFRGASWCVQSAWNGTSSLAISVFNLTGEAVKAATYLVTPSEKSPPGKQPPPPPHSHPLPEVRQLPFSEGDAAPSPSIFTSSEVESGVRSVGVQTSCSCPGSSSCPSPSPYLSAGPGPSDSCSSPFVLIKEKCDCPKIGAILEELVRSDAWKNLQDDVGSCRDANFKVSELLNTKVAELNDQIAVAKNYTARVEADGRSNTFSHSEELERVYANMKRLEDELLAVKEELAKVARESVESTLRQVKAAFEDGGFGPGSEAANGFARWLKSEIIHAGERKEIHLETKIQEYINVTLLGHMDRRGASTAASASSPGGFMDVELIRRVAQEQIRKYDADKTGMADFALETSGGTVLSTRCTESYKGGFAQYYVWGVPIWWWNTSPRYAIQPSMSPGECWAFKGKQGYLVIRLSASIYITGFTMEHIPKSIAVTGNIDSAPKDFVVYGLTSERDPNALELGSYTYSTEGESIQYFPVQSEQVRPHEFIELNIRSNWGNPEYTCLYRIRVHGHRA